MKTYMRVNNNLLYENDLCMESTIDRYKIADSSRSVPKIENRLDLRKKRLKACIAHLPSFMQVLKICPIYHYSHPNGIRGHSDSK